MTTVKSKDAGSVVAVPSADWLRVIGIGLCLLGLLVAGYMSWAELTANETACLDTGKIDCAAVQNSAYAEMLGVPIAVIGFLGYLAILGVLVLEDQVMLAATYGRTAVVGMALFGVIFQAYLTVIEATVLDAWCQWCVASFVIITALLVVGVLRLRNFLRPLQN